MLVSGSNLPVWLTIPVVIVSSSPNGFPIAMTRSPTCNAGLTRPGRLFGILEHLAHLNILYNPEVDQCFCLLEAPTMEAVQKHHAEFGIKCDWIIEVKTNN